MQGIEAVTQRGVGTGIQVAVAVQREADRGVTGQGGNLLGARAGAVWVLSGTDPPGGERDQTGRPRRLDQRTGTVTATTPLPDLAPSRAVGPVVGGGAVWLGGPYSGGLHDSGILLRVDPGSGRVTGWLRGPPWLVQDVLAAGPHGAWVGTAGPALLHVVPA